MDHPPAHVRADAVARVGEMQTVKIIPILVRIAFDDGNIRVQMEVLEALQSLPGGVGKPGLEAIARTHPRNTMRAEAAECLARLP